MIKKSHLTVLAVIALAIPATVFAMQSVSGVAADIFRTFDHSASKIYDFEGTPVKLDTSTGAIHAFRGDAGPRGTSGNWSARVQGVGPGLYELQRAGAEASTDGVFLVDVRTGDTWILRWRGNQNGAWQDVK